MNCEQLAGYLPDLVDGTLPADILAEAREALEQCPDCKRDFELASQIHNMLTSLQAEYADLRIPTGFEARLFAKIRQQNSGLEWLDLSSRAFGLWLIELINLLGGLFGSTSPSKVPGS